MRYSNSPVTGQPPLDRARRQTRLTILDPHHLRPTSRLPLGGDERQHVGTVTSSGTLATCVKNTFRSNAVASTVFGRARAATISR